MKILLGFYLNTNHLCPSSQVHSQYAICLQVTMVILILRSLVFEWNNTYIQTYIRTWLQRLFIYTTSQRFNLVEKSIANKDKCYVSFEGFPCLEASFKYFVHAPDVKSQNAFIRYQLHIDHYCLMKMISNKFNWVGCAI